MVLADLSQEAAMKLFMVLSKLPSVSALDPLKESISVEFPEDLEETHPSGSISIPDGVDASKVSYYNYDEAHSGRFSTFGTKGATIEADHVLDRPEPLHYIRDNVAYGSLEAQEDCVVFVQGLRTASQPEELVPGMIASQRIECYSDILNGMRIAQVHTGTNLDQANAKVNVNDTYALKALTKLLEVAGLDMGKPDEDGNIEIPPTAFDIGQALLSGKSAIDTPIKETIRKLLPLANAENRLVLMVYSRGSIECCAAINEYIKAHADEEKAFHELRAGVTVLSIGSATGGWPDGPAYVHLSSWEDTLPRMFCNAERNLTAGSDAVFLHNNSPYPGKFDAHNFQAGTSQFLTVVMMANNVNSIRDLWEMGQVDVASKSLGGGGGDAGGADGLSPIDCCENLINTVKGCLGYKSSQVGGGSIAIPSNVDELTDAMISITDGHDYLWDKEGSIEIANASRPLPDKEAAVELLKSNLPNHGDEIDTIYKKFMARKEASK